MRKDVVWVLVFGLKCHMKMSICLGVIGDACSTPHEWVHFVHISRPYNNGTYEVGTLEYWVNGVQDRAEFISSDNNGYSVPNRLWLGYDDRWKIYSDLDVAYVRMYKGELRPAQIRTNYALTKGRFIGGMMVLQA